MRRLLAALTVLGFVASGSCSRAAAPEFRPTATVKDIMDSIIDPSADFIWDSVEIVVTLQGTEEKAPKADDDWKALRRHAITLLEASNLLLVPGRRIAGPGEKAEDARIDLNPDEIEARVTEDPAAWMSGAHQLHDAVMVSLKAIDAKDKKALLEAGDVLDQSCETCHRKYWYRVVPGIAQPEITPSPGPP